MSDPRDDDDLMLAYGAGDAAAFDQLYARYREPLYRYLVHATGQRAVADDLYQDVWSRIIGARKRFERGAGFKRWAFRIAHNRLIDHWRSQKPSEGEAALSRVPDEHPGRQPEAELARNDLAAELRQALMALPRDQREAFLLQQEAGLSLAEIAKEEGVGRETIKSRLRYAINKLKDRLGPTTETPRP